MTKQELIAKGFKYIITQNCEQKTEIWAKFTGYEDVIQYWYYFPNQDTTNPGGVNVTPYVSQLDMLGQMRDKLRTDFFNHNIKYDKSSIWYDKEVSENNSSTSDAENT